MTFVLKKSRKIDLKQDKGAEKRARKISDVSQLVEIKETDILSTVYA